VGANTSHAINISARDRKVVIAAEGFLWIGMAGMGIELRFAD
jgi:hypothetical protein